MPAGAWGRVAIPPHPVIEAGAALGARLFAHRGQFFRGWRSNGRLCPAGEQLLGDGNTPNALPEQTHDAPVPCFLPRLRRSSSDAPAVPATTVNSKEKLAFLIQDYINQFLPLVLPALQGFLAQGISPSFASLNSSIATQLSSSCSVAGIRNPVRLGPENPGLPALLLLPPEKLRTRTRRAGGHHREGEAAGCCGNHVSEVPVRSPR